MNKLLAEDTPGASTEEPSEITPEMLSQTTYRWDKVAAGEEWTMMTSQAIDTFGLLDLPAPSDIETFCPRFKELTRLEQRMFWIYLFSAMTEKESSFRPATFYQENFKDLDGNFIISRGLLQLSIESSNGYGCNLDSAQELHDPETNLNCGMRIFTRHLKKDGVISGQRGSTWLGGARYWAVLRTNVGKIKAWTVALPLCN